MSKPTYNLLNQQSLLKSNASKEEKILAQAKLEVFETLGLNKRKPMKIGDIAYQIFESRKKTWNIPNEVKVDWNAITIDQNSYRNIFDSYHYFLWENNQKWIEGTDWALAQRLILDSGNMITFEDDKVVAEKAYEELNQDQTYKDKIELLQKKRKNKFFSLIKRTEEEQRKIDEALAKKKKELEERKAKKNNTEDENNLKPETEDNGNENQNNWTSKIEETKEDEKENTVEKTPESKEILRKWLLVNRDNLADKIRELREWSGFSNISEIEIQSGVFIDIKKNKEIYTNFLEQYLQNEWDKKELEKLDTQFSEMLIISRPENVPMDQKYWIQINNDEPWKNIKSEEELETEAKICEESLKKAGYDVEYIKLWENLSGWLFNTEFIEKIIKEIEELKEKQKIVKDWILAPIDLARLIAKENLLSEDMTLEKLKDLFNQLSSKWDLEVVEQERLLIYKEALQNRVKDKTVYHVVRRKKQKEIGPHIEDEKQKALNPWPWPQKILPRHKEQLALDPHIEDDDPIPPPPPPPPITQKKERTATISNVESVHLEEANHRAEELARKEYEALGKLNLFDAKTRKARERMKTFALRSLRRQQRRNRHLSSVKWNVDLTREDVVFASDRHEMESSDGDWNGAITRRLTNHQNPDIDLLCKTFLTTNMLDRDFETKFNNILRLDPTVTAIIGNNNMDYLASNILLKLKNEKAEYTMVDEISKLLVTGTTYNATNFQTQLNTITGKYFTETKKNYPNYIQKILDNINDPIEINKIIKHQQGLLNEDVKTLQMQLQLLDNTTGAYEINNKDKERWFWYKFGAWMDRHPYLTVGWSILAGTWILATGWLIGWVAWAATATWLIATKIGMMTAAKKASHYTKEQKGQEKRLTHGLNIEKQAMDNIKTVMNNAPWYSWRKYKAKRQFKLYQESTQKNVADTTRLTEFINRFVAIPGALPPTEEAALRNYLSNGLARVDYYKKTGHNFVASQDKTKVEIDMRNLYTAITQWAEKLGTDIATIRWNTQYTSLVGDLTTDYDTSMENFKTQRRNLELKYGIWAGMLYAWTAVGLQYVLGSWIFGNYPCGWTQIVVPWTDELALHEEVKTSLANAWATQQNITNIENALKNAPTSASADWYNQHAWRTIVKNEMWWQDTQLNSWMHDFMKDTLWTLNEWWSEFQRQLLDANINSLTSTSPAAKTAEAFLSSPKIGLINEGEWAKILADLQKFIADPNSIATFTAEEKMKMWYYGHLFIGNDSWVWSRLTEQLTKMTTVWWTTIFTPEEICNRHYWLDGVGMPVFANTFIERMKPNKNEVWKPIETTQEDPVPDPTIVITDKNNPASTSPTPTYSWLTGK